MDIHKENLDLNLGCGRRVLPGWFNIDIQRSPKAPRDPEMLSDVKKIALPDGCARTIMAIHLWEHFYRWECDEIIVEWKRLLKSGGRLILEMPDLFKFCKNILEGKDSRTVENLGMWGLYGNPNEKDRYMCHHWGWTFDTIKPFLEQYGFTDIVSAPTFYHKCGRLNRDFRVEAIRP